MRCTAIVLQARMGSTRLPGKALADARRAPAPRALHRTAAGASGLPVVLATTERPEDDCAGGGGGDVSACASCAGRSGTCSRATRWSPRRFGLTSLVRATGDNPAVDIDAPRRMLALLERTGADHVVERGLPYGAAVEAVAVERADDGRPSWPTDPYDREHVTPFIRRDPRFRAFSAIAPGDRAPARTAADRGHADDLDFMRRLFAAVDAGRAAPGAARRAHARRPTDAGSRRTAAADRARGARDETARRQPAGRGDAGSACR